MNILVSGGSGYIGTALVPALIAAGHEVTTTLPGGVRFDIRDQLACEIAARVAGLRMPGSDQAIVHLASDTTTGDWAVNVHGTCNLLRVLPRDARFVFASSLSAAVPWDSYDASKSLAEKLVLTKPHTAGVVLRLGSVYGDGPQSKRCVLNLLMRKAAAGEPLPVFGNAMGRRDYVNRSDVVSAFVAALSAPAGVYDVGSGIGTTMVDAVKIVGEKTGVPVTVSPEVTAFPHGIARPQAWLPNWNPRVGLENGISQTLHWIREHEPATQTVAA